MRKTRSREEQGLSHVPKDGTSPFLTSSPRLGCSESGQGGGAQYMPCSPLWCTEPPGGLLGAEGV